MGYATNLIDHKCLVARSHSLDFQGLKCAYPLEKEWYDAKIIKYMKRVMMLMYDDPTEYVWKVQDWNSCYQYLHCIEQLIIYTLLLIYLLHL